MSKPKKLKITFEVEATGERAQEFIDRQKEILNNGDFDDFSPYGGGGGFNYRFHWEPPVFEEGQT